MSTSMTRREFLRRSAPLIATGVVSTSFVATVARKLFGPKKYWDMGAAHQKAGVCLAMDVSVQGDSTVLTTFMANGVKYQVITDFRITDISVVKTPLPGPRFEFRGAVRQPSGVLKSGEVAQPG